LNISEITDDQLRLVPSSAQLLTELRENGEKALSDFCARGEPETLHFEFKQKENPSNSNFEKIDKQNFGKLLSAFSNSDGGVIVWGVCTERNDDNIDVAKELKPISGIQKFFSQV
jgi:predicted HTH transcriptional regulator